MSQKDIEENYGLITANRTMLKALIREVVSGPGAVERADRLEAALQGAIDNVNDASPERPEVPRRAAGLPPRSSVPAPGSYGLEVVWQWDAA